MFFNKTTAQLANEQRLKEIDGLNFFTRLCNKFSTLALSALYHLGVRHERKRIQSENKDIRDREISQWVGQNIIAIVDNKYPVIGCVERLEDFTSDTQYSGETFLVVRDYLTGEVKIPFTRKVYALNQTTLTMFTRFPGHQVYSALVNDNKTIFAVETETETQLRIAHIKACLIIAGFDYEL